MNVTDTPTTTFHCEAKPVEGSPPSPYAAMAPPPTATKPLILTTDEYAGPDELMFSGFGDFDHIHISWESLADHYENPGDMFRDAEKIEAAFANAPHNWCRLAALRNAQALREYAQEREERLMDEYGDEYDPDGSYWSE